MAWILSSGGSDDADLALLLREIGLGGRPSQLSELANSGAGIEPDDLDELRQTIETAAAGGEKLQCKIRVAGSGRVLDVRGGPAPPPEPAGSMLLWLFDTSASEDELSAQLRLQDAGQAPPPVVVLLPSTASALPLARRLHAAWPDSYLLVVRGRVQPREVHAGPGPGAQGSRGHNVMAAVSLDPNDRGEKRFTRMAHSARAYPADRE